MSRMPKLEVSNKMLFIFVVVALLAAALRIQILEDELEESRANHQQLQILFDECQIKVLHAEDK